MTGGNRVAWVQTVQLLVHFQGNQLGPFPPAAVAEMLQLGTITAEAQVWHEGLPDWVPVNQFLAQHLPAPAASAPALTPLPPVADDGPSESAVVIKALVSGFVVALLAGAIFGAIEAKLGDASRGARRLTGWLLAGLGWVVGFTVSRVSRGYDSWLLVGGAAVCALAGLVLSVFVAGFMAGEGGGPTLLSMGLQIVVGTLIAGYVAKAD